MANRNVNAGEAAVRAFDAIDRQFGVARRTLFQELMVAEYSSDFSLDPTHGLSVYRDIQTTANGGSIAEVNGAFRLRTGTTANGSARLETAQRGQYISALTGLAGQLVFLSRLPTGNEEATWGYYDADEGFWYGVDATGPYVRMRTGGVDGSKIRRNDWLDPLDGGGASGLTLDFTKPTICRINMNLYGQGPAAMAFVLIDSNGDGHTITVHNFNAVADGLIVRKWSLPIRQDVDNGGDTTSLDLFVGGRQFGNFGRRQNQARTTSETRFGASLSGTTIVPIISVRKKSAETQINVRVEGFTPLSADDLQLLLILDGGLTGASFGAFTNIAATETSLEVDVAATAITGGNAIYEDVVAGGQGSRLDSPGQILLGQEIPEGQILTLAARKVSGTGGTITATLRMEEDF